LIYVNGEGQKRLEIQEKSRRRFAGLVCGSSYAAVRLGGDRYRTTTKARTTQEDKNQSANWHTNRKIPNNDHRKQTKTPTVKAISYLIGRSDSEHPRLRCIE
jgi:hypothetical protein